MTGFVTGIILAAAFGPALSAGEVKLGETREYGDWVAGCDNALSCQAVAFSSLDSSDKFNSLKITRSRSAEASGFTDLSINIKDVDGQSDRYRLFVDGRLVDTGAIDPDRREIIIAPRDGLRLAREIAHGYKLRLEDGNGNAISEYSLKGSAASLRYVDAKLGLSGTRQAIVARGALRIRPVEAPLPLIVAKRITAKGAVPETADIVNLVENSVCGKARFGVTEDIAYPLGRKDGRDSALVLISCGSGAYNSASGVYVATSGEGGKWRFEAAPFDLKPAPIAEYGALPILTNAAWNPENQTLSSYNKARGLADCGDTLSYVWDGGQFRLVEAQRMPACRGAYDWITVWRAKVEFEG